MIYKADGAFCFYRDLMRGAAIRRCRHVVVLLEHQRLYRRDIEHILK